MEAVKSDPYEIAQQFGYKLLQRPSFDEIVKFFRNTSYFL